MTIIKLYRLYLQARALYTIRHAPHDVRVVVDNVGVVSHSHEAHPKHSSSQIAVKIHELISGYDRMSDEQKIKQINTDTVFLTLIERMSR
jgi:hypothetical protein